MEEIEQRQERRTANIALLAIVAVVFFGSLALNKHPAFVVVLIPILVAAFSRIASIHKEHVDHVSSANANLLR